MYYLSKARKLCDKCGCTVFFSFLFLSTPLHHWYQLFRFFAILVNMWVGYKLSIGPYGLYQFLVDAVISYVLHTHFFPLLASFLLKKEIQLVVNQLVLDAGEYEVRFWPHLIPQQVKDQIVKKQKSKRKKDGSNSSILLMPLRQIIWEKYFPSRYSAPCPICNHIIIKPFQFHAAHIIPKSKGGSDNLENRMPVCASCNLSMGSKNLLEYKRSIAEIIKL